MSEPASISSGIAERYASAIFSLAQDEGGLDKLQQDADALDAALRESEDFRALIHSPIYSRDEQQNAIGAIADKMGLGRIFANTLRLMASKRRLFVVPAMLAILRDMIADAKGEITADVTAAQALSDEQKAALAETLKKSVGKDVKINMSVDDRLIGGLIVKVGSKMIDTSIRAKLNALQNRMKEVG
ncbi:F0F1 ATP synthase subunit delta [Oceaniglobus roseus]|uniref:F0F1 ATP synthase subunit delta n=1 Tax=Oceaniglobus roseus TaxID=1737570 RepID=UPI0015622D89|nr:F0F1 ATP synthase subunit delta [Kandeliimicrobium roseum]